MEVLQYLEKTLNGDKQAFNFVINMYERRLYLIARSRLENDWDIKDVMQDTFSYAYFNLDKLKDLEKFNSWITKILINKCNKIYVHKKRVISYEAIEADNIFNEGNEYEKVEDSLDFFDRIKFLKKEDRTLMTMYFMDSYTTKEISNILHVNESTLRSRLSKIKNEIRKEIRKENPEWKI